jgi:hypothetical protein
MNKFYVLVVFCVTIFSCGDSGLPSNKAKTNPIKPYVSSNTETVKHLSHKDKIIAEKLNKIGINNVSIKTDFNTKNKIRCNINWEFAWYRDPINFPLNNKPNDDLKFSLLGVDFIIVSEPAPKKEHYPSDENTPNK